MKPILTAIWLATLTPVLFAQAPSTLPAPGGPAAPAQTPPQVPPAPEAPGTPAPATAPAPTGGASDLVQILSALGPLGDRLVIAFSMDHPENGSIVYNRQGLNASGHFQGAPRWTNEEGRQCVSFAAPGTKITGFLGAAVLKNNYTMATWMKFPVATGSAVVWDSGRGAELSVKGGAFLCGKVPDIQTFCTLNSALIGWHHVAVTADGERMQFFLDGVLKGTAPIAVEARGLCVGAPFPASITNAQCDCLDDMFFFDRPLTAAEIASVSAVRLPIHPPTAASLAAASTPSTAPGAPPSSTSVPAAAELVKTYRNSLVFVSGADGAGSGFLASYANQNLLFTNAHVAAGVRGAAFKTLDGENIRTGAASVAVGEDIFLMQATSSGKPLEIMQGVDQGASIGDEVVVLGNAGGAGVINTIMGKIIGIGPNLIETDAPFIPGNSGSPIIHLKSGKVIAIATYATIKKVDSTTKKVLATPEVRRFGYRLDSVKSWQPVNWAAFSNQAVEMEKIEALTADLIKFLNDVERTHKIAPGLYTNPAIKSPIADFQSQLHPRMSAKDASSAVANLISYLKAACRADIISVQPRITYDYFQRKLTDEQRDRTALADIFEKSLQAVQTSAAR